MARPFDVRWMDVAAGLMVTVIGTAVLTSVVLLLDANVWWVSAVAMLALMAGGIAAGLRAGQIEPMNGALVMAFFFIGEAVILMVGTAMEWLPEPLPGLPRGDSTFYFVSPLGQLAAAVAGSVFGGWWATRGTTVSPEASKAPPGDSSDGSPGGV